MFDNSLFFRISALTDDLTIDADFRSHLDNSVYQYTRFKQLSVTGLKYKPYIVNKEVLSKLCENVVYLYYKNELPMAYRDNTIGKTVVYGDLNRITAEDIVLGTDLTCIGLLLIRFGRLPQGIKFNNKVHTKIKYLKLGDKENDIYY